MEEETKSDSTSLLFDLPLPSLPNIFLESNDDPVDGNVEEVWQKHEEDAKLIKFDDITHDQQVQTKVDEYMDIDEINSDKFNTSVSSILKGKKCPSKSLSDCIKLSSQSISVQLPHVKTEECSGHLPTDVLKAAIQASELYKKGSTLTKDKILSQNLQMAGKENDFTKTESDNAEFSMHRCCKARKSGSKGKVKDKKSPKKSIVCSVGPIPGTVLIASDDSGTKTAAVVDPKRARRIIANRESAQRSKERRLQYIMSLEQEQKRLTHECKRLQDNLSATLEKRYQLTIENEALIKKGRVQDAVNHSLRSEIEQLRHANKLLVQAANNKNLQMPMRDNASKLQECNLVESENDCDRNVDGGTPTLKKSNSMLEALGRALTQSVAQSNETEYSNFRGHNWLADFNVHRTSYSTKFEGLRRKNTH